MVDYSIVSEIIPLLTADQHERLVDMIGEAQASEGRLIGAARYEQGYRRGYSDGAQYTAEAMDVYARPDDRPWAPPWTREAEQP